MDELHVLLVFSRKLTMDIHFQMGEAMCDLRLLIVHVSALERDCPLPHILHTARYTEYFDGLVQDCSNSSALAMELLQSCTKPSICSFRLTGMVDQAAIIGTVKLVSRQFTNIYICIYICIYIVRGLCACMCTAAWKLGLNVQRHVLQASNQQRCSTFEMLRNTPQEWSTVH